MAYFDLKFDDVFSSNLHYVLAQYPLLMVCLALIAVFGIIYLCLKVSFCLATQSEFNDPIANQLAGLMSLVVTIVVMTIIVIAGAMPNSRLSENNFLYGPAISNINTRYGNIIPTVKLGQKQIIDNMDLNSNVNALELVDSSGRKPIVIASVGRPEVDKLEIVPKNKIGKSYVKILQYVKKHYKTMYNIKLSVNPWSSALKFNNDTGQKVVVECNVKTLKLKQIKVG